MAGVTIKLQTNIPVTGVVEYVDFIPTRNPEYSDQIAVRGKWDVGEGRIYLPLPLEAQFMSLGICGPRQANGNYPLKQAGIQIKLLKTENGQKRLTTVEVLSVLTATADKIVQQTLYPASTTVSSTQQTSKPVSREILALTMTACLNDANAMWQEGADSKAVAATASTLFIERCRRGLLESPAEEGSEEMVPFR